MYRSNRNFNITPATWQPPGHLTFWKIIVQISPYPNENAVQMPHILESIQVSNASIPRTLKNFLYNIHYVGALQAESADTLQ